LVKKSNIIIILILSNKKQFDKIRILLPQNIIIFDFFTILLPQNHNKNIMVLFWFLEAKKAHPFLFCCFIVLLSALPYFASQNYKALFMFVFRFCFVVCF
jgi:hypothetical protein